MAIDEPQRHGDTEGGFLRRGVHENSVAFDAGKVLFMKAIAITCDGPKKNSVFLCAALCLCGKKNTLVRGD